MKFVTPNWPAPTHVKSFTTTRAQWGGRNQEQTSNTFTDLFALPSEPIWLQQTHSTIVLPATLNNAEQIADASFTSEPNRVCVVLTADCLPLFITDKQGSKVSAIHAGWRGLANGIIENTLDQLQLPAAEILVWLGPAIGPTKFEVGHDVYQAFTQQDSAAKSAFKALNSDKWLANLYELARLRLQQRGISAVYGGDYCTHSQADLFFSYRRDQGKTGRMASVIWIG